MKKVFVDTNIIIDLMADRKPFSKYALEIFDKGEKGKVLLFTSTLIVATSHYILKKFIHEEILRSNLLSLLEYVNLVAVDRDTVHKGLKSKYKDFEDAIQILCAHNIPEIDYIVTRNPADFREAGIKILAPDELMKKI